MTNCGKILRISVDTVVFSEFFQEIGKNWKEIMSEDDRECTRSEEANSDETE